MSSLVLPTSFAYTLWHPSAPPRLYESREKQTALTSDLSFRISDASSSHCWVYCHLAVFSLSTTWSRWTCFCSSSSFCSSSLLKLLEGWKNEKIEKNGNDHASTDWTQICGESNFGSMKRRKCLPNPLNWITARIPSIWCQLMSNMKPKQPRTRRNYLASLMEIIHAEHSDSVEARSSYCRWFSRL